MAIWRRHQRRAPHLKLELASGVKRLDICDNIIILFENPSSQEEIYLRLSEEIKLLF